MTQSPAFFAQSGLLLLLALCPPTFAQRSFTSMHIDVDATLVTRRLIHSHLEIPLSGQTIAGNTVTLSYPLWNPGDHAPIQNVGRIGSLFFHADGKVLTWHRDLVDPDAFHIELPPGAATLTADFDFLLPLPGDAFADSSARLLMLRWNLYTLYIAGLPVRNIPVDASVILPRGWQFATALPIDQASGNTVHFKQASLETVVDSPILSGLFLRKIELTPGAATSHELDVAAESEADLPTDQSITRNYGKLAEQAQLLFGTEHFRGYHFLIAASDYTSPSTGFEHLESSDDRLSADFFRKSSPSDLLSHEYAHSWNGKYRRPADLYPIDYQQPEETDLLWVYESLTNYMGVVLASRSGLLGSDAEVQDRWAALASRVDHETGRNWRNIQDTAVSVPVTFNNLFFAPVGWDSWLRLLDYYEEGTLIWLEANAIIVEQTHGQRSLEDFFRSFYGGTNGLVAVHPYTEQDIFTALNQIAPYDWAAFFHERLTSLSPHPPLGGLERSGWKLVYTTQPPTNARPNKLRGVINAIGLSLGNDGTISDVLRGGPADAAGLSPGMKVVAVNGQPWSPEKLVAALTDSTSPPAPLRLGTEFAGVSQEFLIAHHDAPRYPHLERVTSRPDLLTALSAPRHG